MPGTGRADKWQKDIDQRVKHLMNDKGLTETQARKEAIRQKDREGWTASGQAIKRRRRKANGRN